ncbi:FtsX-like permease family protein [Prolixibacteraceae bacterium Z1-6]|uniref:FtsX-like permease family protein n=1 Tax=Draconibacterium aestuarii TaxID=2998507 RepID=A0A9X3F467_9BACT|nr:FtsX-like permease family protein [Prolixibacteraceae bacterium Z1-6]
MITAISWKNVWRNKHRSMIVIVAVTLGTVAGVFVAGMMKGWSDQRVDAAIYTEAAHLKVQNPEYLNNEEITYTIPNYNAVKTFIENQSNIEKYTSRTKVVAMAATSRGNTAVTLKGINPDDEKKVSNLYEFIEEDGGSYFDVDYKNPIVISDKTAEQLRIKTFRVTTELIDSLKSLQVPENVLALTQEYEGRRFYSKTKFRKAFESELSKSDARKYGALIAELAKNYQLKAKIVFTFTDMHGDLTYQSYRVCGIYKTSNTAFDAMNAFVLQDDLARVAGFGPADFHEIAALINLDNSTEKVEQLAISTRFPEVNVMTWREMAPDAAMLSDIMDIYYFIIMSIIFLALAFGIVNTMLMSIMERIKELGMLMAIGMNKKKVFRMIMLETVFLTLTGSLVGMGLGALVLKITNVTGLDFSSVGEGFEAFGYAAIVYPNIEWSFFFAIIVLVIVVGILSSISPARKALKLKPIDALRTE